MKIKQKKDRYWLLSLCCGTCEFFHAYTHNPRIGWCECYKHVQGQTKSTDLCTSHSSFDEILEQILKEINDL